MNDGQANLMAEMKKMQETILSALSMSGRSDNYGMFKEFMALQAEVKQMKEDQEKQKIEMKQSEEAHKKALEDQKAEYEKVCDELAELKTKQSQDVTAIRGETAEMKEKQDDHELKALLTRSENYGIVKEFMALKTEVKQMKENPEAQKKALDDQKDEYENVCKDLEKQKDEVEKLKVDQEKQNSEMEQMKEAHEKALEEQKIEYKKVCDELAELRTKQNQDVADVREETAEMKKAYDLKLQNHDDSIRMCKVMSIEELIVGKWKMVSSTGREDYDKQMLTYDLDDSDRAKIDYENREFIYDGTLRSYVDNDSEDPAFSRDYKIITGTVVYRFRGSYSDSVNQLINIDFKKKQLVVLGCLYEDSKPVATCHCYYDRV